jgi:glycosyltransferase involved in cell wall biosynthesis
MRILILTHQGGTAGSTFSIFYLARGLAQRGHKVFVGCRSDVLLFQLLENTPVYRIPMTFHSKIDLKNIRQIKDLVTGQNIQLINAQSGKDRYTSIFANMLYSLNIPIVHTRRQIPLSSGFFLQNWFYTKFTRRIIAVSNGVKDSLINMGIPPDHITVIHNGTPREKYIRPDLSRTDLIRKSFNIAPSEFVIGCVSRSKKQEQLLRALAYVNHPVRIIFIGIETKSEFHSIIQSLNGFHKIHFLGTLTPQDTLPFYSVFNLNILPSTTEGLSQSLLEAMAFGVPVIATNAAGNMDLIHDGHNGLLFEDKDIIGLADRINRMFTDQELRDRLIENGKKTALEDFSIEKTIEKHEALFADLINQTKQEG